MHHIIAKSLSTRLLILQSVFSVGGVWLKLPSHLEMQLKIWLVQKHLYSLGMQLNNLVYKKLHTYI